MGRQAYNGYSREGKGREGTGTVDIISGFVTHVM
jgi:hypothetical protein